ncbi:hypothetical protein PU629_16940 [Pullulanibacillus sp. KACC 23026]|uniref:hypothetical protein n=1 Tax=Pullulanibacillus sp. KACC 23026 TaxID=3028315 RepID=UPI0023B078CE|nr:hypothetical protein [Pullulanibacillus sp. KACC 23026]WEG11812.1 hypothetical protein PU629_16940 [Pullulanibacillus sp. KACC 23026]
MITAHIKPIIDEDLKENPLFHTLEIHMQRLGFLVPFREQLNWTKPIDSIELGEEKDLKGLKKLAAKNDGSLPFILKFTKKTTFQQLILHPNINGLYLPFRFDEPFMIQANHQTLWIGSLIRLADELKWLEISINKDSSPEVKDYWLRFRETCEAAKEAFSPFILSNQTSSPSPDKTT